VLCTGQFVPTYTTTFPSCGRWCCHPAFWIHPTSQTLKFHVKQPIIRAGKHCSWVSSRNNKRYKSVLSECRKSNAGMSGTSFRSRAGRLNFVTLLKPIFAVVHWYCANLARNTHGCCRPFHANANAGMTMHTEAACDESRTEGRSLVNGKRQLLRSLVNIRMTGSRLGITLVHLLMTA